MKDYTTEELLGMDREERIKVYNRPESDHTKIVPREGLWSPAEWTEAHNSILRHKPKKVREGE